ncbi:hypothetical protein O1R50_25735 [Glycomyces luteolus]|uniref:Uncharacterized protein n=1 Tax=Glycomyces luteolus TaxID=2670330 RepID=A0A9X3T6P0_9ACTN|nr:hypothetical protein [Glycomyces luteolus]MDA1363040.1 hypothetical protein [Glycomyces luteolus]
MNRVIRRVGPLVLWQYAVCLAILPLYFPIALLALENTWPRWLLSRGVIVALVIAFFVWRNPVIGFIDRAALLEPEGEAPRRMRAFRVERHFGVFLTTCLMSGLLSLLQSLSMIESWGMAHGLLTYLITWHFMLILPLMLWARNRDAERRLPPERGTTAPGVAELWILPPEEDGEDGLVTVAVKVDGIRSLEEVVVAVLGRQVLPEINVGKRRWSIVVVGVSVGELTQTWQHPRWWPPIEWNASPSSLFRGQRIALRPIDSGSPESARPIGQNGSPH